MFDHYRGRCFVNAVADGMTEEDPTSQINICDFLVTLPKVGFSDRRRNGNCKWHINSVTRFYTALTLSNNHGSAHV